MNRSNYELLIAHDCGNVSSIVYDPYLNNFRIVLDGNDSVTKLDVNCIVQSEKQHKYQLLQQIGYTPQVYSCLVFLFCY